MALSEPSNSYSTSHTYIRSKPEQQVQFELEWLFNQSDSDCGIKSNFEAFVSVMQVGPSTNLYQDPYNDFILKATRRKRLLTQRLAKLPANLQTILYYSFADVRVSPQIERVFKNLSGAVLAISNPDRLELLCHRLHIGTANQQDRTDIAQLRIKAQSLYHQAIEAFRQTRERFTKKLTRKP